MRTYDLDMKTKVVPLDRDNWREVDDSEKNYQIHFLCVWVGRFLFRCRHENMIEEDDESLERMGIFQWTRSIHYADGYVSFLIKLMKRCLVLKMKDSNLHLIDKISSWFTDWTQIPWLHEMSDRGFRQTVSRYVSRFKKCCLYCSCYWKRCHMQY